MNKKAKSVLSYLNRKEIDEYIDRIMDVIKVYSREEIAIELKKELLNYIRIHRAYDDLLYTEDF